MNASKDWPPSMKPWRESPPEDSVGIVLPVRDNLRFFKLAFHSIADFTDHPYMLTIVDNMSAMETVKYLRSLRVNHYINILQHQKDHNLASIWNLGIRFMFSYSTVSYGLVLTPNIVTEPFWLSNLVIGLKRTRASLALPSMNVSAGDVFLFTRKAYSDVGGIPETDDPLADFSMEIGKHGHAVHVEDKVCIHKFKQNGFDYKPAVKEKTYARA